ncbi:hypothetical protein TNCV_2167291 [Trichonephila clavipes]|nr:hypothetical protein TNCV_2167291 [Trichonephila clavipes]
MQTSVSSPFSNSGGGYVGAAQTLLYLFANKNVAKLATEHQQLVSPCIVIHENEVWSNSTSEQTHGEESPSYNGDLQLQNFCRNVDSVRPFSRMLPQTTTP